MGLTSMLSKWNLFLWRGPPVLAFPEFASLRSSKRGFPGSSTGTESACNAEDPSSIAESGRSPEGEIGYPLQYSWACLVTQLVKNPPAMWETWV